MQIVIEIDEDIAQGIIDGKEEASRNIVRSFQATIADAIKNGTPLPKGHGRLIDGDELDGVMYHEAFEKDTDLQKWDSGCWIRYKMFENKMADAPTIIESESEE